jgi:hypothetical protein
MRPTINLAEDALIAARNIAWRERMSLGDAESEFIRRASAAGAPGTDASQPPAMRGRLALLPARDEIATPQHVRELMERKDL